MAAQEGGNNNRRGGNNRGRVQASQTVAARTQVQAKFVANFAKVYQPRKTGISIIHAALRAAAMADSDTNYNTLGKKGQKKTRVPNKGFIAAALDHVIRSEDNTSESELMLAKMVTGCEEITVTPTTGASATVAVRDENPFASSASDLSSYFAEAAVPRAEAAEAGGMMEGILNMTLQREGFMGANSNLVASIHSCITNIAMTSTADFKAAGGADAANAGFAIPGFPLFLASPMSAALKTTISKVAFKKYLMGGTIPATVDGVELLTRLLMTQFWSGFLGVTAQIEIQTEAKEVETFEAWSKVEQDRALEGGVFGRGMAAGRAALQRMAETIAIFSPFIGGKEKLYEQFKTKIITITSEQVISEMMNVGREKIPNSKFEGFARRPSIAGKSVMSGCGVTCYIPITNNFKDKKVRSIVPMSYRVKDAENNYSTVGLIRVQALRGGEAKTAMDMAFGALPQRGDRPRAEAGAMAPATETLMAGLFD